MTGPKEKFILYERAKDIYVVEMMIIQFVYYKLIICYTA